MEQTWDFPMQMTAVCMACTIFVELYEVLQIEVVQLAQKLFGVSNYSMLIAEAGNSCRQMGQSVKTSQSDSERRAGEAALKEVGYSMRQRQRPNSIIMVKGDTCCGISYEGLQNQKFNCFSCDLTDNVHTPHSAIRTRS